MPTYDPDRAPDPQDWLATEEGDRIDAVRKSHQGDVTAADPKRATLHAITHVIIENQLALADPAAVKTTYERLTKAGVSRHNAVHAIGSAFAAQLFDVMSGKAPDMVKYEADLAKIDPGAWGGRKP